MRSRIGLAPALALAAGLAACTTTTSGRPDAASIGDPYPSTYRAYPGTPTALVGATIYDGAGGRIDNGTVLLADGKVVAIGGPDLAVPAGYGTGSAGDVNDLGAFVTALSRTLGHCLGEGECVSVDP